MGTSFFTESTVTNDKDLSGFCDVNCVDLQLNKEIIAIKIAMIWNIFVRKCCLVRFNVDQFNESD